MSSTRPPRESIPTAKMVAELAKVSVSTVSRVMNDRPADISADTRARVQEAALKLRYRPSSLAGALRRGYTRTVGLVVPDISDAYFHQIARGMEDTAQNAGYSVILCNTDRVAARERSCIEMLYDHHVDGIVFAGGGVDGDRHLHGLPWDRIHVVTVGPHELPFPSIRVDDAGTIRTAMEHLLGQGRHRVLCIAGHESWLINTERVTGYRQALEAHAIPYDHQLVRNGDFTVSAGRRAVTMALDEGLRFDAVMAFNDYSAVGAIDALQERGRRVPEDVAVVGCDDIALASLVHPRVSSVNFPQRDFGVAAMSTVLDLIADRPVQPVTEFDYRLRVRASSAPDLSRVAGNEYTVQDTALNSLTDPNLIRSQQ